MWDSKIVLFERLHLKVFQNVFFLFKLKKKTMEFLSKFKYSSQQAHSRMKANGSHNSTKETYAPTSSHIIFHNFRFIFIFYCGSLDNYRWRLWEPRSTSRKHPIYLYSVIVNFGLEHYNTSRIDSAEVL